MSAVLAALGAWTSAAEAQPYAYVANLGSDTVSVVDAATQGVVATIPVGDDPDGVAVTPDGLLVYVSNFLSDDIHVIDTATNTVTTTIPVDTGPVGLAVSPDGAFCYVTNRGSNTVSVVGTATNAVLTSIPVGLGPDALAVTPDGAHVYVTNSFSKTPGTVSVIDTATRTVTASIDVYRNPNRIALTPDGRLAYVTNFRSWNVAVIETASNTVVATIPLFGRPSGVAVHPNGAYAYVVTLGGSVAVIEVASNEIVNLVSVGDRPYGIGLSHNGGLAYVAAFGSSTASVIDLATETLTDSVAVGTAPFAVAVNCAGAGCTEAPFTPGPTRTRAPTATPTSTRPPTPTRVPTRTPTPVPSPISIEVSSTNGLPGQTASVEVALHTHGRTVAAAQNDLEFDPMTSVAALADGKPDCAVNPAIDKAGTFAFQPVGCSPGNNCTAVRALVVAFDNVDPIADGVTLYTCRLRIADGAPPVAYALVIAAATGSDPTGSELSAIGVDGEVVVGTPAGATPIPTHTPHAAAPTPTAGASDLAAFLCSRGGRDGLACESDDDCPNGVCVIAQGVCDAGADDGEPCECIAGTCSAGMCTAGPSLGSACDPTYNCAGGTPCRGSQRVCLGGSRKGFSCLRNSHCPGSRCESTGQYCAGGDFESFACVDNADCPGGTCIVKTNTPLPTPTIDRAHAVSVDIGSATGASGQRVRLDVSLQTRGHDVSGVQNDIGTDSRVPIAARPNGRPDCAVNPAIDKSTTSFAFQPAGCHGAECTATRALVFSFVNNDPIPDGSVLYSCNVDIPAGTAPGTYGLTNFNVAASTPEGVALPAFGTDGAVVVTAAAGQSARALEPATRAGGGGCAIAPAAAASPWIWLVPAILLLWPRRRGTVS